MQKCRGKLDAAALRIFACVIMAIDHIGLVFFSSELWIRVIGRLAFPIFAF